MRPRVLGTKAQGILETKEPRQYPIEFEGPVLDPTILRLPCRRVMRLTNCRHLLTPTSDSPAIIRKLK